MTGSRIANKLVPLLVCGISLLLLYRWFGPVIRHPDQFLFAAGGDGLKNYYTLAYYLHYDSGTHFTGMNYPFGEHIVYIDNQPLLAMFLSTVQKVTGLPLARHAVGILNILLISGILVAGLILYRQGRRAHLPGWYAAPLAVLLVMLSPQQGRLLGHYGLAYCFLFPVCWYCSWPLLRRTSRHRLRWLLTYLAVATLVGFVHPYHLLMTTLFMAAATGTWLLRGEWRYTSQPRWAAVVLVLATLLPTVFFQIWLHLTDPVLDRPTAPYGFLEYISTWQSVFLPTYDPLRTFWQAAFRSADPIPEGTAYIGLVATLVALLSIFRLIWLLGRRRWRGGLVLAGPVSLQTSLWAALLVLLFALGIPFIFDHRHWVDYLGPLRQFRSIGRFAWVFYYVFGLYAGRYLYVLFRYLRLRRATPIGLGMLLVAAVVWATEGGMYFHEKAHLTSQFDRGRTLVNPAFPFTERLALHGRVADDFQAILPLPYYSVGSEKFGISRSDQAAAESMKASLELHLPIATAMLSRTSTSQALQLVQLLSQPIIAKRLLSDLPSRKPFLLVATHEAMQPAEAHLLQQATLLDDSPEVVLYELPLTAFATAAPPAVSSDSLRLLPNGLRVAGSTAGLYHDSFTSRPAPAYFGIKGAWHGQEEAILANWVCPATPDTAGYDLSIWCWARSQGALPVVRLRQQGTMLTEAAGTQFTDVVGSWVRVQLPFHPDPAKGPIQVVINQADFLVDELLIRPRHTTVAVPLPAGGVLLNNFPVSRPALAP